MVGISCLAFLMSGHLSVYWSQKNNIIITLYRYDLLIKYKTTILFYILTLFREFTSNGSLMTLFTASGSFFMTASCSSSSFLSTEKINKKIKSHCCRLLATC